jgi:hypothetical protein
VRQPHDGADNSAIKRPAEKTVQRIVAQDNLRRDRGPDRKARKGERQRMPAGRSRLGAALGRFGRRLVGICVY